MTLKKTYDQLETPDGEKNNTYTTKKIFRNHQIGKNFKSQPSLLFKTKNKSNNTPYFGKNIFLEFAIPCTIIDGGKNLKENFTILSCISEDKEIKKIFLEVCETTFSDISENPSEEEILKITQSIIDLFKNLPDAKKGFIGLWGELFLITSSHNQLKILDAWHNHVDDKYDFYNDNAALEVKCTTKGNRNHNFRHHQLISKLKDHYVASILTKENYAKGLSVNDLFSKIMKNKLNIPLKDKLNKIYYKIIGKTPEYELNKYKYDYEFAKKNLLYFKVSEINTLINNDQSITEIEFLMDLSQKKSLEKLNENKFTSYLHFPD